MLKVLLVTTALGLLPAMKLSAMPLSDCSPGAPICIAAHRGRLSHAEAENSLRQMRRTAAAGGFMLEMDLAASRNGELFLMHDPTVDRTTDGHGSIAALDDAQVAGLHLRDGAGRVTREAPPRFEEVVAWADRTPGVTLMLDIKKVPPATVAPLLRQQNMIQRVIVLTFDSQTARAAFAADPDWLVSVLVHSPAELAQYQLWAGSRRLAAYLPTFAATELFRVAHAAGALVIADAMSTTQGSSLDVQAQRDGAAVYRRFLALRPVDILVTDRAAQVDQLRVPKAQTAATE